ncbi:HTTM domain-containing protein [Streptomyces jumonjinensis]|uniref:HTTM domain-containing protein n=1 Tax=Streptomyces jumonjinensis TaxID=1945 RepID=UPI0037AD7BE0
MTATRGGWAADALQRITAAPLGRYQSAVVRIGFAGTWLFFLLREFPHRHELYGPEGPWSWELGRRLIARNDSFTVLMWTDSGLWFETVYLVSVLSSVLLMLGWRTRAMSVVFMVGVLSLQNRSIFMGDGGDNVIHLMAIYLVMTRCGRVWSLEARAAARRKAGEEAQAPAGPGPGPDRAESGLEPGPGTGPGPELDRAESEPEPEPEPDRAGPGPGTDYAEPEPDRVGPVLWSVLGFLLITGTFLNEKGWPVLLLLWGLWAGHGLWWLVNRYAPDSQPHILLDAVANLLHNAALLVIMVEVCLIYATAGWYKVQGSRWQDGTALYYPLNLDYFTPWPALSGLLASGGVMVMVLTYVTVIVQVAFPFTLFNRPLKNVLLVFMMLEHAAIAVVLGLPFFSLAMIAADAVFLPTVFLVWLGARAAAGRKRLLSRSRPSGSEAPAPAP